MQHFWTEFTWATINTYLSESELRTEEEKDEKWNILKNIHFICKIMSGSLEDLLVTERVQMSLFHSGVALEEICEQCRSGWFSLFLRGRAGDGEEGRKAQEALDKRLIKKTSGEGCNSKVSSSSWWGFGGGSVSYQDISKSVHCTV